MIAEIADGTRANRSRSIAGASVSAARLSSLSLGLTYGFMIVSPVVLPVDAQSAESIASVLSWLNLLLAVSAAVGGIVAWAFRKELSMSDRHWAAFGIAAGVTFILFLVTNIVTGHVLFSRYF